jgi:hypothetical protein
MRLAAAKTAARGRLSLLARRLPQSTGSFASIL